MTEFEFSVPRPPKAEAPGSVRISRFQQNQKGRFYEDRLSFYGMWHREPDGAWKIAKVMWNSSTSEE